jgi:hypothetical protein
MPVFRIVYIDDDTFAPRTLTAAFADRAAAEAAMARHGHRIVHMAQMRDGESAADPVRIPMAGGRASPGEAAAARRDTPTAAPRMPFGLAKLGLAGVAAAGIMVAGVAILLF